MNQLIPSGGAAVTMTSLELVAIINKDRKDAAKASGDEFTPIRHDSFMAKVAKVIGEGVQKFLDTYQHHQNGQSYPCYCLPKREASLMVMSESYAVQARVYDRMAELESCTPAPAALSRLELLELAMSSEKERIALAEQIAADAPAVAFVEKYVDATGLLGFRQVCKLIKAKENLFSEFLLNRGIWYRLLDGLLPPANRQLSF